MIREEGLVINSFSDSCFSLKQRRLEVFQQKSKPWNSDKAGELEECYRSAPRASQDILPEGTWKS